MMRCFKGILLTWMMLGMLSTTLAQTLPGGAYHGNREREVDLIHYKADLTFDFAKGGIEGVATITLKGLRELTSFSLDAVHIKVAEVKQNGVDLKFENTGTKLEITLPKPLSIGQEAILTIAYRCVPQSGVSFYPVGSNYIVSSFGEGGLHSNWMPVYNELNDKFFSELVLTVPDPYVAVANGNLIEKKPVDGHMTRFHWKQSKPHSAYLIAFYIGQFERGELASVNQIPLGYWVPKGSLAMGEETFKHTPKMMAYFNRLLDYPFPWDKYDQIAVPSYTPIAMEHTSVTGLDSTLLRNKNASLEFNFIMPGVDWSIDYIVAHELAHHWFGNNVTCRDISYIWMNESLTTYMGLLWVGESRGLEQFQYDVNQARKVYVDYAHAANTVRPLEYHYYDNKDAIFDVPITYLKGGAILHMLRYVLGDEEFFSTLRAYLKQNEFSNVVSNDLKRAVERTTGRDLSWFFDQWIIGGGHPHFKVSYRYLEDRQLIDLTIQQTQSVVDGQGYFTLPVELTIATASKTWTLRKDVEGAYNSFLIECPEPPKMVSFDGGGALIQELDFAKSFDELAYQIKHDQLPGRLWATEQLAAYPGDQTVAALLENIKSDAHWSIRAAAAVQLGNLGGATAESALVAALADSDYHVRRDAASALGKLGSATAAVLLKGLIEKDPHEDVVCAAILALASSDPAQDTGPFVQLLSRASWNDLVAMTCMQAFSLMARPELVPHIQKYCELPYNSFVRMAAVQAWQDCDPNQGFKDMVIRQLSDPDYFVKSLALAKAGQLYLKDSLDKLKAIVEAEADATLISGAQAAIDEIKRIHMIKAD